MPHTSSTLRRCAAVAVAVALVAVGLGMPGPGLRPAVAQDECDAQCWAILYYLTQQGLTAEEIEDLGDSGIPPDPDTPEDFLPPPTVTTTTLPPAPTTAPTTAPPPPPQPTTTTTTPTLWRPTTTPTTTTATPYSGECNPTATWACDEINAGIDEGYLPEGFNPHDDVDTQDLLLIIEDFGDGNPNFDEQAARLALQNAGTETDRGEMFNVIAAGLDIPYNPEDPFEVADELADLGILYGHDADGDGITNPYTSPDADTDGELSNAALAALLDRIQGHTTSGGSSGPKVGQPTGGGPTGGGPSTPDTDDACSTSVVLTAGEILLFAAQLRWETVVRIEAHGEPGVPWPPHPDVPGGAEFLVVSKSPVWPVVDPGTRWEAANQDGGCVWVATHVETQVSQMLPWRSGHRRALENDGRFDAYLGRWDHLTPAQQSQAIRRHQDGEVSARCALETAMVSEDSYEQCRWELPESGVWSWRARACFEAGAGDMVYRDCATLSQGVEWFLGIIDYTSGITVRADPGGAAGLRPRHLARVG